MAKEYVLEGGKIYKSEKVEIDPIARSRELKSLYQRRDFVEKSLADINSRIGDMESANAKLKTDTGIEISDILNASQT